MLVVAIPVILILGFWAALTPVPYAALTSIALIIILVLFSTLTVEGDSEALRFYFGPGIIRKRMPYANIKSVKKVRNYWFYGWGIRWYGAGWLYNVSGLDAIELVLSSGTKLRIGTDEPDKLVAFLSTKIRP